MTDIRQATMDQHRRAEKQKFVSTMMSGKIHPRLYATYLYNLAHCYGALEETCQRRGLLDSLPGIAREHKLRHDCQDLWVRITPQPEVVPSTLEYISHIGTIQNDTARLYAHVYVRYLGDLYGGQIIKSKTPGPNTYLEFDNAKQLIVSIRETINDYTKSQPENVVEEAKKCFEYATKLFIEMEELNQSQYRQPHEVRNMNQLSNDLL